MQRKKVAAKKKEIDLKQYSDDFSTRTQMYKLMKAGWSLDSVLKYFGIRRSSFSPVARGNSRAPGLWEEEPENNIGPGNNG